MLDQPSRSSWSARTMPMTMRLALFSSSAQRSALWTSRSPSGANAKAARSQSARVPTIDTRSDRSHIQTDHSVSRSSAARAENSRKKGDRDGRDERPVPESP